MRRRAVDCRQVGKLLQSYLDDETDEDIAAKIRDHLQACKDCGLEAETYRRITRSLAAARPEVDDAALARLRAFGEELTSL